MKFLILIIVLQISSQVLSSNAVSSNTIRWKYISLDSEKHSSEVFFNFKRNSAELSDVFTIHENLNLITSDAILYGVDLSNNQITDDMLDQILLQNQDLLHSVKLLNLSGNDLKSWSASNFDLLENLEVLILDKNYQLKTFKFNSTKLKILGLNNCNLAYVTEFQKSNLSNLVYLGKFFSQNLS